MDIEKQVARQNLKALIPHEWQIFEQALSKPFFLALAHQEAVKNPLKNASGE